MSDWTGVIEAITLAQQGDPGGRDALLEAWGATADDDSARRLVLAHYLADREPVLADEVAWDELALAEYPLLADDALAALGIPSARGLLPSLHLNLGDGYLRQGRVGDARAQLDAGLGAVDALADDGYAAMIRDGMQRLGQRVTEAGG